MQKGIFLVAVEEKDIPPLSGFKNQLEKEGVESVLFLFFEEIRRQGAGYFLDIAVENRPIFVTASVLARNLLSLIRPRNTFVCIGIEHGIAPFKSYTYSKNLLESDYYLAPTKIWYDRLIQMYPESSGKILLGGYPRLEVLRSMKANPGQLHSAINNRWVAAPIRNLVVLSWGVSPQALASLPDRDDVIYLLHPSADINNFRDIFKKSQILVSDQYITPSLVTYCTKVYGDFSSLTLEVIAIGIRTKFIVQRSLYEIHPDIENSFFDESSGNFLKIPHTKIIIPPSLVIKPDAMAKEIESDVLGNIENTLPTDILPPSEDNREITAKIIRDIVMATDNTSQIHDKNYTWHAIECARVIIRVYRVMLKRLPDLSGFKSYLSEFMNESKDLFTLEEDLRMSMKNSKEWRAKNLV